MDNTIRCSNDDCSFYTNKFSKFKSKLIGDDGYYYCNQCSLNKEKEEDAFIQLSINNYNYYFKYEISAFCGRSRVDDSSTAKRWQM